MLNMPRPPLIILRLTKLLALSSPQPRKKSIIQITRTSPTLRDTGIRRKVKIRS